MLSRHQRSEGSEFRAQTLHETLTFQIRQFMARSCRADSQRHVFNTTEFLCNDIETCIRFKLLTG